MVPLIVGCAFGVLGFAYGAVRIYNCGSSRGSAPARQGRAAFPSNRVKLNATLLSVAFVVQRARRRRAGPPGAISFTPLVERPCLATQKKLSRETPIHEFVEMGSQARTF